MKIKIKVGLVFGGRSGEHEVSVRSAKSIFEALNKNIYEVSLLGIDKRGIWHRVDQKWLPHGSEMKSLPNGVKSIVPEEEKMEVFFPIVHGTYGEDGCMQGLFELMNAAYVGAGVLGSAVGMDKDVQKRLLIQAGIPVAKYWVVKEKSFDSAQDLTFPVFVKPANMGSSVGVSRVVSGRMLDVSLKKAFEYDTKVIIEEEVKGRELEVAVLDGKASLPGEVIPKGKHKFYDYEAKYTDENGAELLIPAKINREQVYKIQRIAEKTFRVLECEGMARVDMFMKPDGELVINEINTLPGFTSISMYPKLWEATGVSYGELLDRLIKLALAKKAKKDKLRRSFGGV